MPLFTSHPELDEETASVFQRDHEALFEDGKFIATNNEQVVKSFTLGDRDYVIKRYPERGLRANFRSMIGDSRAMNSFRQAAQLKELGIQCPRHLFVARHPAFLNGMSYLIMQRSAGIPLRIFLTKKNTAELVTEVIDQLAKVTKKLHHSGLTHGDLHAGNLFVRKDRSIDFIDLDNMKPNLKRQGKDLTRLLRSFDEYPELRMQLKTQLTTALNQES